MIGHPNTLKDWHDGDSQRLAAIAEADASHHDVLDAINGKGEDKIKKGKLGVSKAKAKEMTQHKPIRRQKEKVK